MRGMDATQIEWCLRLDVPVSRRDLLWFARLLATMPPVHAGVVWARGWDPPGGSGHYCAPNCPTCGAP